MTRENHGQTSATHALFSCGGEPASARSPSPRGRERSPRRQRGLRRLRRAYFASACESASRYGVSFSDVMQHLWLLRRTHPRLRLRNVRYLDDLVHAIACVQGSPQAWCDLAARYERPLIRRCRGVQDEIEATMLVRRTFADLRRLSEAPGDEQTGMNRFAGTRSLRSWLADRLEETRAAQQFGRHQSGTEHSKTPRPGSVGAPGWNPGPLARIGPPLRLSATASASLAGMTSNRVESTMAASLECAAEFCLDEPARTGDADELLAETLALAPA